MTAASAAPDPRRHLPGWRRIRWPLGAILGLAGLFLIADGLWIKAKASLAQILLERAWEQTLSGADQAKPWSWVDTWPVAKIEAPAQDASSIILHGVSGQAMAFGPGLMTAGPYPGEPGLAIISAHRDTHFRFLKHVGIGDPLILTTAKGERLTFRITETRIVDAKASGLSFAGNTPRIALATCWPFDALQQGPKRFVAIATLEASAATIRHGSFRYRARHMAIPGLKAPASVHGSTVQSISRR